jgi:hypothetical protein
MLIENAIGRVGGEAQIELLSSRHRPWLQFLALQINKKELESKH